VTVPRGDRSGSGSQDSLHVPFRPRLARAVSLSFAVAVVVLTPVLAIALPTDGSNAFALPDRLGILAVGAAIVAFLWRQASVSAVPDADGLTVRNLVFTRRLAWAEIVSVRFGSGRPWVQLDLADGDTLAVMGVQESDGARAVDEARRLATLVALHTQVERDS
jgi:PH (Pleckstrin Homology) domain-containing protein